MHTNLIRRLNDTLNAPDPRGFAGFADQVKLSGNSADEYYRTTLRGFRIDLRVRE
jgi:hypothetical protein